MMMKMALGYDSTLETWHQQSMELCSIAFYNNILANLQTISMLLEHCAENKLYLNKEHF